MATGSEQREARERASLRGLGLALALAALAAPGALSVDPPGALAGPDPLVLLVWLAIVAPAAGCAAVALGLRAWPFAAAIPGAWMIALVLVDGASERDLPSPLWGALAVAGLFAAGGALGHVLRRRPWAAAAALLLVGGALAAAPGAAGRFDQPWPPRVAACLLDLSPATLAAECAGVDWMRHASVYDSVATDRFERTAWSGALAGPLALVLGCVAWALAARVVRRRDAPRNREVVKPCPPPR